MTTKAGTTGLLTGLFTTLILALLTDSASLDHTGALMLLTTGLLYCGAGWLGARWSGSREPLRCAALGGLAGGLAGALVFCLIGAAAAALPTGQDQTVEALVWRTQAAFLLNFGLGISLGALGGWFSGPKNSQRKDEFDNTAPQMALNAAITAVPASVVAAGAAAATFAKLPGLERNWPLAVALWLTLISQAILALVLPHEARAAEHRCGLDEVKMAAYVGIGAAPLLMMLLFFADHRLLMQPWLELILLLSFGLSLATLRPLFKLILPRRATFPEPPNQQEQTLAYWFGSIADSRGPRLVILCVGCGLVMVLPIYSTVFSVLINLMFFPLAANQIQTLFATQALTSTGLVTAAVSLLSGIYLLYLNLGRWFKNKRGLAHLPPNKTP